MDRLKLFGILGMFLFTLGFSSCASSDKDSSVEVEPTMEELERQEMEELGRMEKEELDALKEEEESLQDVRKMEFGEEADLSVVNYGYDRYNLSSDSRDTLSTHAEWMKTNPTAIVQIEGHCDERGTEEYNLALGEKRATAAKDYLISLGVDRSRIYTISYGEERPVNPAHNDAAWAANRRSEFRITVK